MHRIFLKIKRKVTRLLLRPVHVYVFHHVSDVRDPLVSGASDWTKTEVFKQNILALKKKHSFIPLDKAWAKIQNDKLRLKSYAALTTDDGLTTVPFIFPWLESQGIPLTCFINSQYLDGLSHKKEDETRIRREDPGADVHEVIKRQYMTAGQLESLSSPHISIALHGNEHFDSTSLSEQDFIQNVELCRNSLYSHSGFSPFFAYPWGKHSKETDRILKDRGLVPVLVDGEANCHSNDVIHRECIDGQTIK